MAADQIKNAVCYIHRGIPVDVRLLHEHHKHPKGFGGSPDDPENLVWLCGSCHDVIHRLAHFIRSDKKGLASDLAYQYQTAQNLSPSGRQRLVELANIISKAMTEYVPNIDDESDEDTVIVQLHMPRSLHRKLKTEASKHANQKSGRKMGLYRYILRVLANHAQVASQTPMHRRNPGKYYGVESTEDDSTEETPAAPLLTPLE